MIEIAGYLSIMQGGYEGSMKRDLPKDPDCELVATICLFAWHARLLSFVRREWGLDYSYWYFKTQQCC
jgi:hypothetical protein